MRNATPLKRSKYLNASLVESWNRRPKARMQALVYGIWYLLIEHEFVTAAKIHIFRKTARASKMLQLDFLIAAKLIHFVSDVVLEALDVFLFTPIFAPQGIIEITKTIFQKEVSLFLEVHHNISFFHFQQHILYSSFSYKLE